MIKVKDGYAKLIGTTYLGSTSRVLLSNGGDHVLGNASGNIPLSNGTVNTNLNSDLLNGWHLEDIVKSGYVYSNTANLTSYWGKLWEHTQTSTENTDLTLYLHSAFSDIRGIIHINTRRNSSTVDGVTTYSMSVYARQITGNIPTDKVRLYYNNSGLCQLWVNVDFRWGVFNCRVISCTGRTSSECKLIGTLFRTNFTTEQTLPTYSYVTLSNLASHQTPVYQNTTNNVEYPLVWSNQTNTSNITADQLRKSYNHLTYNPSVHRITAGQYVANNSSGPHFIAKSTAGNWAYIRLSNSTCYWDIATNNSSSYGTGGLWLSRYNGGDHGIFVSTTANVGISTANPSYKLDVNGHTRISGNLLIGANTTRNYIAFHGTTGDGPGSYNHTYIGENLYDGTECSELVLFKGNDFGIGAGPDRIRHIAAQHLFQTYKSPVGGSSFETICNSTVPVNILALNQDNITSYVEILPNTSNTCNLGSSSKYWNYIYGNRIRIPSIVSGCGIAMNWDDSSVDDNDVARPWYGLTWRNGSDTIGFNQMFLSNYFGMTIRTGGTSRHIVFKGGHVRPYSDNTQTLGTTSNKWLRVFATTFDGTATNVLCQESSSDVDRPILVTNSQNQAYYTNKVTLNYSTGNITAPTFTGSLKGNADTAKWLNTNSALTYGADGLNYFNIEGIAGNNKSNCTPESGWYHILRMNHTNTRGYLVDIAAPLNNVNGIYWRQIRSGNFYGWFKLLDDNNSTISDYSVKIGGTTKKFVRDWGSGAADMNAVARGGRSSMGMANLIIPEGTATAVNPNGQTGWHHFINMSFDDGGGGSNAWITQIANKAGSTDLWVRSRYGGTIDNTVAWVAGWTRILTGSNYTSVLDGNYVKAYKTLTNTYNIDDDWGQSVVTFDPKAKGTYPSSGNLANFTLLNLGNHFSRRKQFGFDWYTDSIFYRRHIDSWTSWVTLLHSGNYSNFLDSRYYTETEVNNKLAGYLPLAGGTMSSGTAQIQRAGSSVSWYQGRSNAMIRINSYSGYNAIASMKTTNGDWSLGVHSNNVLYFTYITDTNFNAGTNTTTAQVYINASGNVYATHFYEHSDINLKTNIKPIITSDNIPQLKSFDWKSDGSHSYGLIAQELEEQGYSELVSDEGGQKTVKYSAALSLIVGKLQVKIKELEKEIENLKNKN